MRKLDLLLEILNDTLPIPDWDMASEPHAAADLIDCGVPHMVVRRWLGMKNQHNWEMTVGMVDRRS